MTLWNWGCILFDCQRYNFNLFISSLVYQKRLQVFFLQPYCKIFFSLRGRLSSDIYSFSMKFVKFNYKQKIGNHSISFCIIKETLINSSGR